MLWRCRYENFLKQQTDCVCDEDLASYEGISCERQCPPSANMTANMTALPRLFEIHTETKMVYWIEPECVDRSRVICAKDNIQTKLRS